MNEVMKAIVLEGDTLKVQNVNKPQDAKPGHLIVKMISSAINSGDKFFLKNTPPPGMTQSLYGIRGVSGVGMVTQIGEGVPAAYQDKYVTLYRNLKYSESAVGTWCEYVHVHFLDCAILPDDVDAEDYSGSMVNIITPFSFLKQIISEGHKGIIATAGNSATGIAMLGICQHYNFPIVSIARTEKGRKELEELGAKNVVVQSDADFNEQLTTLAKQLSTTAIFDGVGGEILNKIISSIPIGSVIYAYGFIGDATPFTFHTSILTVRNISIKPFSNIFTETVQNPAALEKALNEISTFIHLPHFKTKIGKQFKLEEIDDALALKVENGGKAVLYPMD